MEFVLLALRNLAINVGDRIYFKYKEDDGVITPISGVFTGSDALGIRVDDDYFLGVNIDSDTIELV